MRLRLALIGAGVLLVLVAAPLLGWPPVVRLPAVLLPALVAALLVVRPSPAGGSVLADADWQPSSRAVRAAAVLVGLLLFWYVLTRFRSGEINAVDFTVYYDRPCFQTAHGRPLFVEVSDTPALSHRSELADHAYWGMLLVCLPYVLHPTPLWLHALSAIAIAAGAVYVLRILQRLGVGGVLASASAIAFLLNDNTARTLNYGFHPEVLYAWFVPWLIEAGLRGARRSFLAATLACLLVKEDACFPLFAAAVALALNRYRAMSPGDRALFLVVPPAIGLANLGAYYRWVVPMLTGQARPAYAHFWGNYGDTPASAMVGMLRHPWTVLAAATGSGIFKTLQPHLFLPLVGWRWAVGLFPLVALYGASANEQVRAFGIYYAIVLVPFLVIATAMGALSLIRRFFVHGRNAQLAAAAIVLLGALLVGSGSRGYSLRPWRKEVAAVPDALARLRDEPVVLVQSGLFPHAGYDERVELLTPETLQDPGHAGAVVLLAHHLGAYPFHHHSLAPLFGLPPMAGLPPGLMAVRIDRPPPPPTVTDLVPHRRRHGHRAGERMGGGLPDGTWGASLSCDHRSHGGECRPRARGR